MTDFERAATLFVPGARLDGVEIDGLKGIRPSEAQTIPTSSLTIGRIQDKCNSTRGLQAPLQFRTEGYDRLLRHQEVLVHIAGQPVALVVTSPRRSLWERMVGALRARRVA